MKLSKTIRIGAGFISVIGCFALLSLVVSLFDEGFEIFSFLMSIVFLFAIYIFGYMAIKGENLKILKFIE